MLTDNIALVTGASRGIGRAVATMLGKNGATVVGTATSEQGAASISAYFEEQGISGKGVVLDVTDTNAIDSVVSDIEKSFGKPVI